MPTKVWQSRPATPTKSVSPGRPPPPSANSTSGKRHCSARPSRRSVFLWFITPGCRRTPCSRRPVPGNARPARRSWRPHRTGAGDQAIGGAQLQQLLGGTPATLGGQGETAIFAEAALVQQVEHVLPRGTLSGLAPPGKRLRTTLVAQRCLALEYLGEIGADMRQVQRLFGRCLLVVILRRFKEQQRRALLQRLPEARREPPDDPRRVP